MKYPRMTVVMTFTLDAERDVDMIEAFYKQTEHGGKIKMLRAMWDVYSNYRTKYKCILDEKEKNGI